MALEIETKDKWVMVILYVLFPFLLPESAYCSKRWLSWIQGFGSQLTNFLSHHNPFSVQRYHKICKELYLSKYGFFKCNIILMLVMIQYKPRIKIMFLFQLIQHLFPCVETLSVKATNTDAAIFMQTSMYRVQLCSCDLI